MARSTSLKSNVCQPFKEHGKPPESVLVEVVDEIIEVFLVGLWSKTLSSNPLNLVPFLMVGVMFHEEDFCHLL